MGVGIIDTYKYIYTEHLSSFGVVLKKIWYIERVK